MLHKVTVRTKTRTKSDQDFPKLSFDPADGNGGNGAYSGDLQAWLELGKTILTLLFHDSKFALPSRITVKTLLVTNLGCSPMVDVQHGSL